MTATDKPANDGPANDRPGSERPGSDSGAPRDDDTTGDAHPPGAHAHDAHAHDAHAHDAVEVVNEYDLAAGAAAYARTQGPGAQADAGAGDPAAEPGTADPGAAEPSGAETGLTETELALLAENRELREQGLRTLAEMDNLRKRTAREKEDAAKFAISKFAKDLLPVADNLLRALQAIPEGAGADNPLLQTLADGIGAVDRELDTVLERHGVRKVEALGAPFDANVHEAVMEQPTADVPPGHVAQVFQPGYTLNDRLLRPAMVAVAKAP